MKFKKLTETATLPVRGSKEAAGLDLVADIQNGYKMTVIRPHETEVIHTGLSAEVPKGCFAGIYARSGLATKRGLRPSNCVGIIDSDYRGEILVAIYNDSDETQAIYHGDRIAQMIIQPYVAVEIEEADDLEETERGAGGFGSTGR